MKPIDEKVGFRNKQEKRALWLTVLIVLFTAFGVAFINFL